MTFYILQSNFYPYILQNIYFLFQWFGVDSVLVVRGDSVLQHNNTFTVLYDEFSNDFLY